MTDNTFVLEEVDRLAVEMGFGSLTLKVEGGKISTIRQEKVILVRELLKHRDDNAAAGNPSRSSQRGMTGVSPGCPPNRAS